MAESKDSSRRCLDRCTTEHGGEDCNFSLRPCNTHPVVVDESVTVEECPRKRFPTKRKTSGSGYVVAPAFPEAGDSEAFGMQPAQERASATENILQVVNGKLLDRVAVEPMAVDLFSEDDALKVNEVELRERIKAALLRFPESASLNSVQLDKSVDRIIEQSKPETASAAAPGMVRLTDDILSIFICGYEKMIPSVDDLLGGPGRSFPTGWIEKKRLELDQKVQQSNKKDGYDIGVLLAKMRVDLITKGYVEVQKEYMQPDLSAQIRERRNRDIERTTAA